ncbi:MAG TPA: hypothetical protein VLL27_10325 [Solirubrobacterales bacterium]|nr:hypothetical protein [Solirubrobacterales bacterium]
MAYWPERGDETIALRMPANLAPGFPTRQELAARYAEASGRDVSELGFFLALGYWKLAILIEGVYVRYAAGAYGQADANLEAFAQMVERLAEAAEAAEQRHDSRRGRLTPSGCVERFESLVLNLRRSR